jgi:hypothetical protein
MGLAIADTYKLSRLLRWGDVRYCAPESTPARASGRLGRRLLAVSSLRMCALSELGRGGWYSPAFIAHFELVAWTGTASDLLGALVVVADRRFTKCKCKTM